MKVLLSILFLLALVGESKAKRNFDNIKKINSVWISIEGLQNSASIDSGVSDEQDLNDFSGPDLFADLINPEIHTTKYSANAVVITLPGNFTHLLQYPLIDLPPPSIS